MCCGDKDESVSKLDTEFLVIDSNMDSCQFRTLHRSFLVCGTHRATLNLRVKYTVMYLYGGTLINSSFNIAYMEREREVADPGFPVTNLVGSHWLPRQLRFENFVCFNGTISTIKKRTPAAPLDPPMLAMEVLLAINFFSRGGGACVRAQLMRGRVLSWHVQCR